MSEGLRELFATLHLNADNGLRCREMAQNQEVGFDALAMRMGIMPDSLILSELKAFYVVDGRIAILFFENPREQQKLHREIWNFNVSPIVFVLSEDASLTIYNGLSLDKNRQLLSKLAERKDVGDFSSYNFATGYTWNKYHDSFTRGNRVDTYLLSNIKEAQKKIAPFVERELANKLIGKIIFIRYLIDRGVRFVINGEDRPLTKSDLLNLLGDRNEAWAFIEFLQDENQSFDGDMFVIEKEEFYGLDDQVFDTLHSLLSDVDVKSGQLPLFEMCDFSAMPVEFISNVYQQFMGEEIQQEQGAYYTPLFIVDYILNRTVDKYLEQNDKTNCRVLDTACGSGIFLVGTLRRLISRYIRSNKDMDRDSEKYVKDIKNLLSDNIFGIEMDKSAVQIAAFSIYLTLLDYIRPEVMAKYNFPKIIGDNLIVANTFDEDNEDVRRIIRQGGIKFIIGNPPWKGNNKDELAQRYSKRVKRERSISVENGELAELFIIRNEDFADDETQMALVLPSSMLYNRGRGAEEKPFKRYLLGCHQMLEIFEMAPVRDQIFDRAQAASAILFFKKGDKEAIAHNEVRHVTLMPSRLFKTFNILTIHKCDIKRVRQSLLIDYPWLMKLLVYGNYDDFRLMRRLESEFEKVSTLPHIQTKGFNSNKQPTQRREEIAFENYPFLDTDGIRPYYIDESKNRVFDKSRVARNRQQRDAFVAPMMLVSDGVKADTLRGRSAVSKKNRYFAASVTSYKLADGDFGKLCDISTVLNSDVFAYYAINRFASVGINRTRVEMYEKFDLPYLEIGSKSDYDKINTCLSRGEIAEAETLMGQLNSRAISALRMDERELAAFEYAMFMTRPIITTSQMDVNCLKPLNLGDTVGRGFLNQYMKVFHQRFAPAFEASGLYFSSQVLWSREMVGVFFKVTREPVKSDEEKRWIAEENSKMMDLLVKLSQRRVSSTLVYQRDVLGFEEDGFYVVKTNEARLWHRSIAYQDADKIELDVMKAKN
jgi:type I restriction-modification system DNA methylase subunit